MPFSLLESYHELRAPANLQAIDRVRSPVTMAAPIPIAFPSTYPFSLIANSSVPTRTLVNGVLHETPNYFNSGLGEAAIVLIVLLLSSPRKDIISFLEATLEIEGPEKLARMFTTIFSVITSILGNEAFPSKWLNVNILAHKLTLKLVEPIASLMIRNFIPEQPQSHDFNQTLWYDYFYMLLKLLSSPQLVIEEFSPQVRHYLHVAIHSPSLILPLISIETACCMAACGRYSRGRRFYFAQMLGSSRVA